MDYARRVWVTDIADRLALLRLIRVALVHGIAPVELAADRVGPGQHVLQVRLGGL